MRFRYPSTLSDFSSSSISDSESVARQAREKSFRARQEVRQEEARTKRKPRQERDEHSETRQERAKHRRKRAHTPEETAAESEHEPHPSKASASGPKKPFPEAAPAEAVNPAPSEPPSSPIKRSLYFIYNNFVPQLRTSGKCLKPTGSFSNAPGAYPAEPGPPSSSDVGSGDDSGFDSTWYSSSNNSSSDTVHSCDLPTGNREPSCHRHVNLPPRCGHHFSDPKCMNHLNQARAKAMRAERDAQEQEELKQREEYERDRLERKRKRQERRKRKQERQEKERVRLEKKRRAKERIKLEKKRQEEERVRLEKERQEEEERKIREQEQKKEEERQAHAKFVREALAAYEADRIRLRANLRKWMEADRLRKEREQRQRAAREAEEKEERERQKARKEEEERNRQKEREEEYRKWWEAFDARHRDRTSKTRSTHNRSHPYARSAKFGRSHSGLHFNPNDTEFAPAAKNVDPLVAHFQGYEAQWNEISSLSDNTPLTFATIPWPLLTIPRTPADVTAARVGEFMRHAKRSANVSSGKGLRFSMMKELKNWHPDKFMTRVLPRIVDDAEREVVRATADVVQKALTDLKSAN